MEEYTVNFETEWKHLKGELQEAVVAETVCLFWENNDVKHPYGYWYCLARNRVHCYRPMRMENRQPLNRLVKYTTQS